MEELYKLIEDYLNDLLPEEQRRAVEQRMAQDEEFRREVDLHRAVQEEFSDPRGWNLYASIRDIMEEEENPGAQENAGEGRKGKQIWRWLFPLALGVIAIVWYFGDFAKPGSSVPAAPNPATRPPDTLPNSNDTLPVKPQGPPKPAKDTLPVNQSTKKPLMASADPRRFEPNQAMEAYIRSNQTLGVGGSSVHINSPQPGATFFPNSKMYTPLQFSGAFNRLQPGGKTAFVFNIYDNKNINDPVLGIPFAANADNSGSAYFEVQKTVNLRLGLYYYQIEETKSGNVLMTGKFFIGTLK